MTDSRPYHRVSFKASHNSFERDEKPFTEQLSWSRRSPHQAGCRGLELDLRESPNLTVWAVHHDEYTSRADCQFSEFLRHLRRWSSMHPRHDVVTVTLDLKAPARDRRQFPRYLDTIIDECLGRDRLFTPTELTGGHESLVAGAMATGWPALDQLRGRLVLCLSGDESTKQSYSSTSRNRLCFADRRFREGDRLPSRTSGDRVFVNFNATEAWDWGARVRALAERQGFITRAYGANSADLWRRAVAVGPISSRPTRSAITPGPAWGPNRLPTSVHTAGRRCHGPDLAHLVSDQLERQDQPAGQLPGPRPQVDRLGRRRGGHACAVSSKQPGEDRPRPRRMPS